MTTGRRLALLGVSGVAVGLLLALGAQRVAWHAPAEPREAPAPPRAEAAPPWAATPAPADPEAAGAPAGDPGQPVSGLEDLRGALGNPDLPVEMKVALIEDLDDATPQAADLLIELAATAEEPELRLAAVEAIALDGSDAARAALPQLLDSEPDPEVRAELYGALALDASGTFATSGPAQLAQAAGSESDPGARLQGFRLVARMLRLDPSGKVAERFDRDMVPWLRDQALEGDTRYARLAAVDALRIADTDRARGALDEIRLSPNRDTADAAARALLAQARIGS